MKKLTMLVLLLSVIALLYGCCSHSKDAFFVNPHDDIVITSREAVIDELGRLPAITFHSGAKVEGQEGNTLTPGIVVTVTEQKIGPRNIAYFSDYAASNLYVYKIEAVQTPENPLESKTYVTTIEKPLKITLPQIVKSGGVTLAGIRESSTDPWRIFNYSESADITGVIEGVNLPNVSPDDISFNLFRLGTEFAVYNYEGNSGNKLPETFVSGLTATSTISVLVKDGKYLEDIRIKGILKGINLDSIKPTDMRARITYRNNLENEAPIKLNGAGVIQTSKADRTVPGYTCRHSFEVDSLADYNLMNSNGEFTFTLNTTEIAIDSFPAGFLIEFYNKVDSEKILPYNYTEFYNVSMTESVTLVLTSDEGSIADEANNLYNWNPTFTITSSYEFSDTDKEKIANAISVSNVDSEKLSKIWNGKVLTLGFTEALQPNTSYTVSLEEIADLDDAVVTPFEDFAFSTIDDRASVYQITYILADGTVIPANPTSYGKASETFTLTKPIKEGYTFIGWTGTCLDAASMTLSIPQGSTGDKEFTANYNPISYNIVYNLEGGEPNADNPACYDITSATIILQAPTKQGYAFSGWTGSNGDEPQIAVTIEQGSTGDREFAAHYTVVDYIITYNLGGDDVINNNPLGYNTASETFSLAKPVREGYTFIGWTGSNGDVPQLAVTIESGSTGDRTYIANFSIINYSITYDGINGCTFTSENPQSYDITSATITLNNPNKEGYNFTGWTGTGVDTASMTLSIPQGSKGNRTYTASFSPTSYTITYNNVDGCTFSSANPESFDITSATISLNAPTRTGYDFLGWTGSNGDVPQTVVSIEQGSTEAKTFTANWNLNINLAIAPDDDMLIDNVNNLYYTKSTFTITPDLPTGLVLTASEKGDILGALRVKDTTSNTVNIASASWNNEGKIALFFTNDLNASSTYSISFGNVEGMTLNCATYTFKTFYYKGRGINNNRFQVENAVQLDYVRNYLNCHFVQTADIDIATYSWIPIGYVESGLYYDAYCLTGSYFGNGKKVKNLKIRNSNDWYEAGLFYGVENNGFEANSGKIASVTVDGVSIRGSDADPDEPFYSSLGIIACYVKENCSVEYCKVTNSSNSGSIVYSNTFIGGICYSSELNTSIRNCNVNNITLNQIDDGMPFSTNSVSGICNESYGTIENCSVDNATFTGFLIGGICSYIANDASITNCHVEKSTFIGCRLKVGGICGENDGEVSGNYILDTTITLNGTGSIGGICGNSHDGTLSECYISNSFVTLNGAGEIGGIQSGGYTENCYVSSSSITLNSTGYSNNIGGIHAIGSAFNCYVKDSFVTLNGENSYNDSLGGITGLSYTISDCYISKTEVKATFTDNCNIGGIAGRAGGRISNSYAFESIVEGTGDNNCNAGGITGKCSEDEISDISQCYILKTSVKFNSNDGYENFVGGIAGYTFKKITECHVSESNIEGTGCYDNSSIGGLVGCSTSNYSDVSKCYVYKSSIKAFGMYYAFIGGIAGELDYKLSKCYISESSIEVNNGMFCNIGGLCGEVAAETLSQSYVLNTNIQSTGSGYLDYIGGLCGNIGSDNNVTSCYFYYDKDNEQPIKKANNDNPFGLFFGYNDFSVSDCFTNKTGTLTGESNSLTETNIYQDIDTYNKFNIQTWTAGAWDSYTIENNSNNWPPNLTELTREN